MQISAELRWFFPHNHLSLYHWFVEGGRRFSFAAGGGEQRKDQYFIDRSQIELGIKRRGDAPGVEIKGLVGKAGIVSKGKRLHGTIQLWGKWRLNEVISVSLPRVVMIKTRWLRKFQMANNQTIEIELDKNEKPLHQRLPDHGCNVEFTCIEVREPSLAKWWTLGFEAFGSLDAVASYLTATVAKVEEFEPPLLPPESLEMSYPCWLSKIDWQKASSCSR
jgi:hypothetical protein